MSVIHLLGTKVTTFLEAKPGTPLGNVSEWEISQNKWNFFKLKL